MFDGGTLLNMYRNIMRSLSFSQRSEAQKALKTLKNEPDNSIKLQIYGLFKQATIGDCDVQKPSRMEFVKLAKWESWNSFKSLTKEDAENKYVEVIQCLLELEDE